MINYKKSALTPTKQEEFLVFLQNSDSGILKLPQEKIKAIRQDAQTLLKPGPSTDREHSRLLGKLNAATRAIPPAPLFYRSLQRDLAQALCSGLREYEVEISLQPESRAELTGGWSTSPIGMGRPLSNSDGQYYDRDRCLFVGLGGCSRGNKDWRPLVRDRAGLAHKLPQTMGSNPGREMPGDGCKELHNPTENGQHHGCGLREQFGRNSVQAPSLPCQGLVDVVSAEGHSSSRSTPPGAV